VILAVAVCPGMTGNSFWATAIGEIDGKLDVLTPGEIYATNQGGFYIGYLNKELGCGLIAWDFIWGQGEFHYASHHYRYDIYKLEARQFVREHRYHSKRKYDGSGAEGLQEIGIHVRDDRESMSKVKDYLE